MCKPRQINISVFRMFQYENRDAFYLRVFPKGESILELRSNIPDKIIRLIMPSVDEFLEGKSNLDADGFINTLGLKILQSPKAHAFFYENNVLSKSGYLCKTKVDDYESAIRDFKTETPKYCFYQSQIHECSYLTSCYNKGKLYPGVEFVVTPISKSTFEAEITNENFANDYCSIYFKCNKFIKVSSTQFPFVFYAAVSKTKVLQSFIKRAYFI